MNHFHSWAIAKPHHDCASLLAPSKVTGTPCLLHVPGAMDRRSRG